MKYAVGDKVRVRNDLINSKRYQGYLVTPQMLEYKGKIVRIYSIDYGVETLRIEDDVFCFKWTEEMFEDASITVYDWSELDNQKINEMDIFVSSNYFTIVHKGTEQLRFSRYFEDSEIIEHLKLRGIDVKIDKKPIITLEDRQYIISLKLYKEDKIIRKPDTIEINSEKIPYSYYVLQSLKHHKPYTVEEILNMKVEG